MINKKGFTLVEIAISVTLLSLVMVFMIKFVSIIRADEDSVSLETDLILTKAVISRSINDDIKEASGIKSLSCTLKKCSLSLNNNTSRSLEVINEGTTLEYKDTTRNQILLTRKLPNNYVFLLSKTETTYLYILEIGVDLHPEYNIEIVDKKS